MGLARKWRPQTFEDLSGQGHISRTLLNAISSGRLSQGYLFTGTRGVGKTTTARLFAKAIRCTKTPHPGVPCNTCKDCSDIAEGRSIDVQEIDGASNNGVDAVRELRDNAKYLPSSGMYKIYIIDEVHMLTTAAFNALLKILEEPPPHLIFIFATTDPQKIPATVLSRCQRFDFKRIPLKELSQRLIQISVAENIEIDSDAITILTREAEGSLRDALSLLDQVSSSGSRKITAQTLIESLGLIDKATLLSALGAILNRDPLRALESVGKVYLHGFDLKVFGRTLLHSIRALMIIQLLEQNQSSVNLDILELPDTDIADLRSLVGVRSTQDLDMLFSMLNHGLEDIARSPIPRTVTDILIIKMSTATELLALNRLEEKQLNLSVTTVTDKVSITPAYNPKVQIQEKSNDLSRDIPRVQRDLTQKTLTNESWPALVQHVKSLKPLLGSVLENLTFHSAKLNDTGWQIVLGVTKEQSFYRDQLQTKINFDLLVQLLKTFYGCSVNIEFREIAVTRSLESIDKEKREQTLKMKQEMILESEAMRAAREVLGGRLEKLEIQST